MEEKKFCGVWGHLKEEHLKKKEPEIYKSLKETGDLEKYLEGYQTAYSNRATKLTEKLEEERGINEKLYSRDSITWLLEAEKVQEEVRAILEKEIVEN